MILPRRLRINPQACTAENVLKYVTPHDYFVIPAQAGIHSTITWISTFVGMTIFHSKQPVATTCFSRFPVSTADFSRWVTRAAIILHAGQLITWTADGIPQIMDANGSLVNWEAA